MENPPELATTENQNQSHGDASQKSSVLGKRSFNNDDAVTANGTVGLGEQWQENRPIPSSPPPKKARISQSEVVDQSSDGGEIAEDDVQDIAQGDVEAVANGDFEPVDPVEDPAASIEKSDSHFGWNQGVTSTLRTSFGGLPKASGSHTRKRGPRASGSSKSEKENPLEDSSDSEPEPTQPADSADGVEEGEIQQDSTYVVNEPVDSNSSGNPTTAGTRENSPETTTTNFTAEKFGKTWRLPALTDPGPNQSTAWQDRFILWCNDFLTTNPEGVKHFSPKLLKGMFNSYLGMAGLKKSVKKRAVLAADAATISKRTDHVVKQAIDSLQTGGKSDESVGSKNHQMEGMQQDQGGAKQWTREEEVAEIEEYFPGIDPKTDFCILCATKGHRADECPETACDFCQTDDHLTPQCPTRKRCGQCKAFGHSASTCSVNIIETEPQCAICTSPDHHETACTYLWRSYRPGVSSPIKVREIRPFCYNCGSDAHFGGDCPSNTGVHISGREFIVDDGIWTAAACDIFIDPDSDFTAIDWAPPLPPDAELPPFARPSIPGRSIVPRTHIHFDSDDEDDDEGFIREPVRQVPKQGGGIRIAGLAAANNGLPPRPQAPAAGFNNGYSQRDRYDGGQQTRQFPQPGQTRPATRGSGPPPRGGRGGGASRFNGPAEFAPPQSYQDNRRGGGGKGRGGRGGRRGGRGRN